MVWLMGGLDCPPIIVYDVPYRSVFIISILFFYFLYQNILLTKNAFTISKNVFMNFKNIFIFSDFQFRELQNKPFEEMMK